MSNPGEIPSSVPDLGTWRITRGSIESFPWYPPPLANGTIEDLSAYGSWRGQIRSNDEDDSTLLCTLTVTASAPTQTDATSVLHGVTDRWLIQVTCPSAQSAYDVTAIDTALAAGHSPVFAFEAVDGSTVRQFGKGRVVFEADRTHL